MLSRVSTLLSSYANERLDAEILLAYVLAVNRAHLHAHPEQVLTLAQQSDFEKLMNRREPVAYLTGRQAFWSLDLRVTPLALIPRSDTELLVELALQLCGEAKMVVADLGTGTGAVALALAKERPAWEIYSTDISSSALSVAKENAKRLGIKNVIFSQGDWCDALPKCLFDIIVSNPPYVAAGDVHLAQSVYDYEPHLALFSEENGLRDIRQIILAAFSYLKSGAYLLLEHGFQQAEEVRHLLAEAGYIDIKTTSDFAGLDRVTMGKKSD
jgi:release factor glutamine methyltransferase